MALVMTADGRRGSLGWLLTLYQRMKLYLYVNDYTPDEGSIFADFDVATFEGSGPALLSQWGSVFLDPAGNATSVHQLLTFRVAISAGSDEVYGYLVLDPSGFLVWAERNPAGPVRMNQAGDTYPVVPRVSAGKLC